MNNLVIGNSLRGQICDECRIKAFAQFIAAREAEKPKAPTRTLEELVTCELNWGISASVREDEIAERIIAIVREHDATALRPTTPNDVLQLRVEVLTRALTERTAELQIAREEIAKRDEKIAAAASALST